MSIEEINKLKLYNEATSKDGIIMPTKETFDTKVKLAINLWPQINESGSIDYLFGKGVGSSLHY